MKRPAAALAAVLVSLALALPAPLAAFTLVEAGASFALTVTFQQAAITDGTHKLAPGTYKVEFVSMADGSVRASFFDSKGQKAGEARGIIAVLKQGTSPAGAATGGGTLDNKEQKGQTELKYEGIKGEHKGQTGQQTSINFAKLGFTGNSRYSFRTEGQSLKLEVFSQDGSHSILIGLLLPAVQKAREAAVPAPQKVQ